jgi:hypothetical protein
MRHDVIVLRGKPARVAGADDVGKARSTVAPFLDTISQPDEEFIWGFCNGDVWIETQDIRIELPSSGAPGGCALR